MADRNGRLDTAQRVERAVSKSVTDVLFGDERPSVYRRGGPSLLADLQAIGRGRVAPMVEARLKSAGMLSRAAADTTTADIGGLLGSPQLPGWVQQVVDQRQAGNLALLAALRTARLAPAGAIPFVMFPQPPQPAPVQTGEKTELFSRTFSEDDGESILPTLIGEVSDLSRQVLDWGGDAVLALLVEDVIAGVAAYVLDALTAAAAVATDLPAAFAAVEASGFPPDTIISSRSAWAATVPDPQNSSYAGIDAVLGPATGDTLYVIGSAGVLFEDTEIELLRQPKPTLLGSDIGAVSYVLVRIATGAVAGVTAVTPA